MLGFTLEEESKNQQALVAMQIDQQIELQAQKGSIEESDVKASEFLGD